MAEPDNFEEDLFADLYTDDAAPQTADTAAPIKAEDAGQAEVKTESTHGEANGGGDNQEYQDEQDMDDDIDFNLGGGGGGGGANNYDSPAHHEQQHGPGIKEDG